MIESDSEAVSALHDRVFLGEGHEQSERKTWTVIWLCGAMMATEIVGGVLFGSIALIADGLHMSTHAGALLLAALAYTFARKHAGDQRFTFGTGKFGDLAGFTSAVLLAVIALLIGYESAARLLSPVTIHFAEAIPIACLGLAVNIASAWLLSGSDHHGHGHDRTLSHGHAHRDHHHDEIRRIATETGDVVLEVFEDGVAPRFRVRADTSSRLVAASVSIETERQDGSRQFFTLADRDGFLESVEEIPEPHAFIAKLKIGERDYPVLFEERENRHGASHRDNSMRAAVIHVVADAAVSVLVIVGLSLAYAFGWLWVDPIAGITGAIVIASWSFSLIRDTGAILLDMNPDHRMADQLRLAIESDGDRLADLHLWRLGPGHFGVILCVVTAKERNADFYRARLARFQSLSHLTIEVCACDASAAI
jgi:cation diffusion facilitator family transporter